MRLNGRCGFCEHCILLSSMAGVVQNTFLPISPQRVAMFNHESLNWNPLLEAVTEKIEIGTPVKNFTVQEGSMTKPTDAESWYVIWYLAAFASLVSFFLVITCVELFFRNPLYHDLSALIPTIPQNAHQAYVPETPPPPYHLFAPPGYEETIVNEKRPPLEIFVVPVHAKTMFAPPDYNDVVGKLDDRKLGAVVVQGKSNPIK